MRRVLSDVEALPLVERAFTLAYTRTDLQQLDTLVPDASLVSALQAIGPDALMKLLRRERPNDDPDLRPTARGTYSPHSRVVHFILAQAPSLVRASDADAVLASAEEYRGIEHPIMWVAAAALLQGLRGRDVSV